MDEWRRAILDSDNTAMHLAASDFLAEFGGVECRLSGSGVKRARVSFEIDPTLCEGQVAWINDFDCGARGLLFPVGEVGDGHASLAIDEDGVLFVLFEPKCLRIGIGRDRIARLIRGDY